MRSIIRRLVPRRIRAAVRFMLPHSGPYLSHPELVAGVDGVTIDPTARLTVLDPDAGGRISLGHGVYLGRGVEVTAAGGGSVQIDEDTSLQDGTIVYGHVRIGAHCLFGKYIFVASRGHTFRARPAWLIRDQDEAAMPGILSTEEVKNACLRIEDDCWLGQSVIVSPGTYVGRGAIIGANSIVTSDVGPYEVHAGAPNRKVGTRLNFQPPPAIVTGNDSHLPYFYRGFRLSRKALVASLPQNVVFSRAESCIVLAAAPGGILRLAGTCLRDHGTIALKINGTECGAFALAAGPFALSAEIPTVANTIGVPTLLRQHTHVEITISEPSTAPIVGISSAKVELF